MLLQKKFNYETKLGCKFKKNRYFGSQQGEKRMIKIHSVICRMLLKVQYMTGTAVIEKIGGWGVGGLTCFRLSTIYSLAGWGGREAHVSSAHPLPGPPPPFCRPFFDEESR